MSYATEHAGALRDVTAAGSAVTFTKIFTDNYVGSTDTGEEYTVTVAGSVVRVRGNPRVYEALGLKETEAPTLLFVPTTLGELPPLGSSVTFGGASWTVTHVAPTALDGDAILARVIVTGGGTHHITEDLLSETRTPLLSESDTAEVL